MQKVCGNNHKGLGCCTCSWYTKPMCCAITKYTSRPELWFQKYRPA